MASSWDDMLDEFRALGGTAENICLKDGPLGRGLFPSDPLKPIQLHTPESLLVDIKYITFDGNNSFHWHEKAPIGARERAFLEAYQRDFSWGANRGYTEALLRMLAEAPQELRAMLELPFNANLWLGGPTQAEVRERYFAARYIGYKERDVLMPVVELVNHSHTPVSFDKEDGIGISGIFEGEILVRYNFADALHMFTHWGFASEAQPFALSLELTLQTEAGEIVIERGEVSTDAKRRPFYPDVKIEGRRITLSYMMLGHKSFPKLAKANFYRIMRNAGRSDAEEMFDKIRQINISQFLKLMAASEHAAPQTGRLIRDVARIQLDAMSHAVGTREL